MKTRNFIDFFLLSCLFSLNVQADDKFNVLEDAIEATALDIRMSNDLTGVVTGTICDGCEPVVVKITPQTRLEINGVKTDLIKAKLLSGKPGLVVFDRESKKVNLIRVYQ